jgi:parallel beta-helix repeat protein
MQWGRKKASVITIFLVILSFSCPILSILPSNVGASTLYVGGTGAGNYTSIQDAIDAAESGNTIFVYNGTYVENVLINKALSLIGEDSNTTTIDGGGNGDVVRVTADWANLTGFTVTNSGAGTPPFLRAGIDLSFVENCFISGNNVIHNDQKGIALSYSGDNTIINNDVMDNYLGIWLEYANDSVVTNNILSNGDEGIYSLYSENGTITDNKVSDNRFGINLGQSSSIHVYHNNIINNTIQAVDSGSNYWDNDYPSGGNYWSDYWGSDEKSGPNQNQPGSDGIGDTPYIILTGGEDRFPLMDPYTPLRPPTNINAFLSLVDRSDVTLEWDLSPEDTSSHTVVRYDILRGEGYNPQGQGYKFLHSVPNDTWQYDDVDAGEGDPLNHFYLVCAVDNRGQSTCSTNQAGKFTRPLSKGLNLKGVEVVCEVKTIPWSSPTH